MISQFRGLYFMVPPSKFKICLNENLHPPFEPEDTIYILLTSFSQSVLYVTDPNFLHTDLWAMGFIHCPYIQGEKSWFIAYSMDWESEFSRRYMIILKHRMIILHRTEVKPETDLFLLFIKSIFQTWQNTLLTYYINTLQVWNNWKSLEDIQNSRG